MRLLLPTGKRPPLPLVKARALMKTLVEADHLRVALLKERLATLTSAFEARG